MGKASPIITALEERKHDHRKWLSSVSTRWVAAAAPLPIRTGRTCVCPLAGVYAGLRTKIEAAGRRLGLGDAEEPVDTRQKRALGRGTEWSRVLTATPYSCIVLVQSDSLLRRHVTGLYNDRCIAPSLAPANVKGSMLQGGGVLVSLQLLDACADCAPIAMLIEFQIAAHAIPMARLVS
jgi:hypothetical protein